MIRAAGCWHGATDRDALVSATRILAKSSCVATTPRAEDRNKSHLSFSPRQAVKWLGVERAATLPSGILRKKMQFPYLGLRKAISWDLRLVVTASNCWRQLLKKRNCRFTTYLPVSRCSQFQCRVALLPMSPGVPAGVIW